MLAPKNWQLEAVLAMLMGLFLIFGMGGVAASLLSPVRAPSVDSSAVKAGEPVPPQPQLGFASFVLATLSFHGAALVLIYRFVRQHRTTWRRAFGLSSDGMARSVGAGVALAGIAVPLAYGLQWLAMGALRHWGRRWGYEPHVQGSVELLLHAGSWLQSAYIFMFATLVAPVAEELLFRGILLPFVRDLGRPRLALASTAIVFGLMHGNLAALVPLTCLGWLLGILYIRTGNLLAPITAHALFNFVPFILLACGLQPES